jgi:hypothetical protein
MTNKIPATALTILPYALINGILDAKPPTINPITPAKKIA